MEPRDLDLRPHLVVLEGGREATVGSGEGATLDPDAYTLRAGLAEVSDAQLERIATRLGVAIGPSEPRASLEDRVVVLLRDEPILGVLVAMLDDGARTRLAAIVRSGAQTAGRPVAALVVHGTAAADRTSQVLRDCGLAFGEGRLWTPVELQLRLDGVLRSLGA